MLGILKNLFGKDTNKTENRETQSNNFQISTIPKEKKVLSNFDILWLSYNFMDGKKYDPDIMNLLGFDIDENLFLNLQLNESFDVLSNTLKSLCTNRLSNGLQQRNSESEYELFPVSGITEKAIQSIIDGQIPELNNHAMPNAISINSVDDTINPKILYALRDKRVSLYYTDGVSPKRVVVGTDSARLAKRISNSFDYKILIIDPVFFNPDVILSKDKIKPESLEEDLRDFERYQRDTDSAFNFNGAIAKEIIEMAKDKNSEIIIKTISLTPCNHSNPLINNLSSKYGIKNIFHDYSISDSYNLSKIVKNHLGIQSQDTNSSIKKIEQRNNVKGYLSD